MDLLQAMKERHSVRSYEEKSIEAGTVEKLRSFIKECNKESGLHMQLVLDEIPELFHRHHITDDLNHFPIQFILVQGRFKVAEMFFVNLLPVLASVIEIILVLPGLLIFPPSHRPGHPGTADRTFQDSE